HLSRESLDQMLIYDTEGFGRGNMGHKYGDRLTQDERMAVIEFLKSLSGPDMPSASPRSSRRGLRNSESIEKIGDRPRFRKFNWGPD
ncbi:MAG: hypothetical protein CMJ93_00420, partial [Planctomycetes bacterium]|nr:hypothetical protein [Planctomycetota bacterium]